MNEPVDYLAPRACLLSSLPEHEMAADLLSQAADAIVAGDLGLARDLARRADMRVLFEHAALVMSGSDPRIQRRRRVANPVATESKTAKRMPSAEATKALFARDGWRCRFCQCRVIPPKVRSALRSALPGAIPWSETEGFHGAFYAMSASVDHVVPHSVGGTNDDENIVTACWSCQFGRGNWSLEEVGLTDPRLRPPVKDSWDGLTRVLGQVAPALQAKLTASPAGPGGEPADVPPVLPVPSRQSQAEWFAGLDMIQPTPSSRLIKFVGECSDLDVSWSLKKVFIVRMSVGEAVLEIFGVQQDGKVEIPWSIGAKKDAFRRFAEMVAAAIPGATAYETPKLWVVSKAAKQRVSLIELLDAAPAIRLAMKALHSDLGSRSPPSSLPPP